MQSDSYVKASEDFNKARTKEIFTSMLNILSPERQELLSLHDVRSLLKPKSERYKGMKTVPISLIVGSEGRYRDFNKMFLPRVNHIRKRWESVDRAHHAQVTLPPVQLYEIGGVYFVRDGNHRVSVARLQKAEAIDAEVIELSSEIRLRPDMTHEELKRAVIEYEKKQFLKKTHLDTLVPSLDMDFTATGRYDEIIEHVMVHKYYINQTQKEEIPFEKAILSWYHTVYEPIVNIIAKGHVLSRFPGRTAADLYVWTVKHWGELKRKYGDKISMEHAIRDFSDKYGKDWWERIRGFFIGLFRPES